ncbi:MAG: TIGR04255 family protein [Planctomycetes bacterium]|nr:TIGR04255 family protein [Planctomycetota bacterium]
MEAVLEIRCTPVAPFSEAVITQQAQDNLLVQVTPLYRLDLNVLIGDSGPQSGSPSRGKWNGVCLQSEDEVRGATWRDTGFSYSHKAPYPGWKAFSDEALRVWGAYREVTKPVRAERIGLRYINRLVPHGAVIDFAPADCFAERPKLPKDIAERFLRKEWRTADQFDVPDTPYSVTVGRAVLLVGTECAVVLDIDVFTQDVGEIEEVALREIIEAMRRVKNEVFFSMLSKKYLGKLRSQSARGKR